MPPKPLTSKVKIYAAATALALLCFAMFGYFFNIFDSSNALTLKNISENNKELKLLQDEELSYKLAKEDLEKMQKQTVKPQDFFSRDITLVNEIRTLEKLGEEMNVEFQLTGLSGTVKNAAKAKSQGEIVSLPFSMNIVGSLEDCVAFLKTVENLGFIVSVSGISVGIASADQVSISLPASFYLRR
jgi:Tfp pilus assembly protein PilO